MPKSSNIPLPSVIEFTEISINLIKLYTGGLYVSGNAQLTLSLINEVANNLKSTDGKKKNITPMKLKKIIKVLEAEYNEVRKTAGREAI